MVKDGSREEISEDSVGIFRFWKELSHLLVLRNWRDLEYLSAL